jgi:thioester reductase-like protein
MGRYGLWRDGYAARIHALPGDLAQPRLGLSERAYDELADSLDLIYHNGASVNWLLPYDDLAPGNVTGTGEALRLAARRRLKRVHYVSTMGVLSPLWGQREEITEATPLPAACDLSRTPRLLGTGYIRSKWAAEHLVLEAKGRGLPLTIYRPLFITGDSAHAAWPAGDFLRSFLSACVGLEMAPRVNLHVNLAPVDEVSRSIVDLSRRPEAQGRVLHLLGTGMLPEASLYERIRAAGRPLKEVSLGAWRARLLEAREVDAVKSFLPFIDLFDDEDFGFMSMLRDPHTRPLLAGITEPRFAPLAEFYASRLARRGPKARREVPGTHRGAAPAPERGGGAPPPTDADAPRRGRSEAEDTREKTTSGGGSWQR